MSSSEDIRFRATVPDLKPVKEIKLCDSCTERQKIAQAGKIRAFEMTLCPTCSKNVASSTVELRELAKSTYSIINR